MIVEERNLLGGIRGLVDGDQVRYIYFDFQLFAEIHRQRVGATPGNTNQVFRWFVMAQTGGGELIPAPINIYECRAYQFLDSNGRG